MMRAAMLARVGFAHGHPTGGAVVMELLRVLFALARDSSLPRQPRAEALWAVLVVAGVPREGWPLPTGVRDLDGCTDWGFFERVVSEHARPVCDHRSAELPGWLSQGEDARDEILDGGMVHGLDLSRARFSGCRFRGVDFSRVRFEQTHLMGCVFENCTFEDCYLQDAIFQEGVFDSVVWRRCEGAGVRFIGGRVLGLWAAEMHLAKLEASKVSFLNLVMTRSVLRRSVWIDCDMTRADLAYADLRGSRFHRCNVEGALLVGVLDERLTMLGAQGRVDRRDGTLVDRLRSPDNPVRKAALEDVQRVQEDPHLLEVVLSLLDEAGLARVAALATLAAWGRPEGRVWAATWVHDGDEPLRIAAICALGTYAQGTEDAVTAVRLYDIALDAAQPDEVRAEAVRSVLRIFDAGLTERVPLEQLDDEDWSLLHDLMADVDLPER